MAAESDREPEEEVKKELPAALRDIPEVEIDDEGVFKYILVEASLGDAKKVVVLGHEWAEYHANLLDEFSSNLKEKSPSVSLNVLGGGRIRKGSDEISVYGYSVGFGHADHRATCQILRKHFPSAAVSWSNEGY